MSALGDGSYSALCERRLVFELSNHSNPSQATRNLIHRISQTSIRSTHTELIRISYNTICHSINTNYILSPTELIRISYYLILNTN